jgi:hypothetical protein
MILSFCFCFCFRFYERLPSQDLLTKNNELCRYTLLSYGWMYFQYVPVLVYFGSSSTNTLGHLKRPMIRVISCKPMRRGFEAEGGGLFCLCSDKILRESQLPVLLRTGTRVLRFQFYECLKSSKTISYLKRIVSIYKRKENGQQLRDGSLAIMYKKNLLLLLP